MSSYLAQLIVDSSIAVILATGLGITYGNTGILSLCHAVFFGAGAFAAALFASSTAALPGPLDQLAGLFVGILAGATLSCLVGIPTLRLRGDFVALATLAFGELARTIVFNVDSLGGARGVRGISRTTTPVLAVGVAVLSILAARRILQSPWGRMAESVRDNTPWATALGVPAHTLKFTAFVFGGAMAGAAGALYAHYEQYIHPDSFGLIPSVTILLAVILGGKGNLTGSVMGSLLVTLFPEALRICLPEAADWRELGVATMLLGTAILFPSGLLGRFPYWDPLRRRPHQPMAGRCTPPAIADEHNPGGRPVTAMVSVSLGGAKIVEGASLTVAPGEFLAVVGPNASGKSTLGRALAGEIPSVGNLTIGARRMPLFPRKLADRRVVVYVSQHPSGFRGLTALDNVRIPADVGANLTPWLSCFSSSFAALNAATYSAAEEALSWVGLGHAADRMFSDLSYGQRKRVLIAAALLSRPTLLILDEPFAGLNDGEQAEAAVVSRALRTLRAHSRYGTILIDHRVQFLEPLCSSMILFDNGKVQAAGPIESILKTAQYRDIYEHPSS